MKKEDGDSVIGMSLRDYFAAMALQGLLANSEIAKAIVIESGSQPGGIRDDYVLMAYKLANAMIEERKK